MRHPLACALALALSTALAMPAVAQTAKEAPMSASTDYEGVFAQPSALDLHYPQCDKISDSDFAPAFDAGMARQLEEIDAIANEPAAPTFANTIVAMEKTGQLLDRANSVFGNLVASDKNEARDRIDAEYSPKFSAHRDAIMLNPKLFARVKDLYDRRASLGLDAIDLRLLEKRYQDFVRAGAALDEAQKARVREINTELSTLGTKFDQNVLAEVNDSAVVVDDVAALKGFSDEQVAAAAEAARARGLEGKYVIALLNTTGQPAETQLEDRALRQRIHEASVA